MKSREKEKEIVTCMISLYCKKKHKQDLCLQCQELQKYACKRIDCCPFMETKTFCSSCSVHCYQKEKREQIKEVMRFAGPRMLFVHPILAIEHVLDSRKEKK
ncbi:MAG: nitrous oxide-stimulated promoter family protein [Floccifex sp.]